MRYTTLGKTGEAISTIGFGGMPLSLKGRPSDEQGRAVIHAAIDAGITLIDTADVYCIDDDDIGHNERLIAAALSEHSDAGKVRVATKAGLRRPRGAWVTDGRPERIRRACEQSLRSLRIDRIWLYQLHAPDPEVPFERSVETFAELQRDGKLQHFGLSNVNVAQIDKASRILQVQSVQNRFSPYFREWISVAEECARRGITFLAYSPVGGSRLAKKLPKHEVLEEIARDHEASVFAVVIAWVRMKAATIVPIPAATKPEHAADSAAAAELDLTADELARIDAAQFSRT